jgi:outer membrane protein assembly factor BamB
MLKPLALLALLFAVACLPLRISAAEAAASKLVNSRALASLGLERAWFGQVSLDRGADDLVSVTQHTSFDPSVSYQIFEVKTDAGLVYSYSQRHRGSFGRPLGVEGAKRLAQARLDEITANGGKATLVERIVPQTILMAQTARGMLHVFDAETGRTMWSQKMGRGDYPSTAAAANDKFVCMLNGVTLFCYNRADGRPAWERKVGGAPSAGPALSNTMVFIPMAGGKVEGYELDSPRSPAWSYKAAGNILVQPLITPRSVAFATDRGWMYVSRPDDPAVRYRLEARGSIITQPTYRFPTIFAASQDGYAYAMHETAGGTSWRFAAGMPIEQPLAAIGNAVYVSPERGGMYRLDATTGAQVWQARLANRFLAASATRVYAFDAYNRLTVVDERNGGVVGQIADTGSLDLPLVNQASDRIYLADSSGLIQCLHEIDSRVPVMHIVANPAEPPIKKAPAAGDEAPAEGAEGEMPVDPALDPAGETPFGEEAPAGEEAMPADDGAAVDPAAAEETP